MENQTDQRKQKWTSDGILLLTAIIWGSGFIPQKIGANAISPFCFNGLRYLLAAFFVFFLAHCKLPTGKRNIRQILLSGSVLFTASTLQQIGLKYSTIGNTSFITTTYIVLVPFIAHLFFHREVNKRSYLAALLALIGLYFLSTSGKGLSHVSPGDILIFIGSLFWAMHIILVDQGVSMMDPVQFSAGQFLTAGLLQLCCWLLIGHLDTSGLVENWLAVLYSGIIVIGAGFTLQAVGQRHTSESEASIILGLESVFGALFGALIFHEAFAPLQLFGAILIFIAVLVSVWHK